MRDRIINIPNTVDGNEALARLILNRPEVLGGNCQVTRKPKGRYLFTLKVPTVKTPIRVGEKEGVQVGKGKNKRTIYAKRTKAEKRSARIELAQEFRDIISRKNKWPCGSPNAKETIIDYASLINEIEFVMDVDDKGDDSVTCLYKENKTVKIRDPESCSTRELPVMDELDNGICKTLVNQASQQVESHLKASTRTQKPESLPKIKIPRVSKMTKQTQKEIKRYKRMNEVLPEVMSIVDESVYPEADDFFDAETISILHDLGYEGGEDENGNFPEKDFDDLSQAIQEKVYQVALTLDEVEGKSQYVQPSEDLVDLLKPIREAARQWKKEQKDEVELVDIPLVGESEETFVMDSDTLKEVYGPRLNKLQQCKPQRKKQVPPKARIKIKNKK